VFVARLHDGPLLPEMHEAVLFAPVGVAQAPQVVPRLLAILQQACPTSRTR